MTPRFEYRVWAPDLTELAGRLAMHCTPIAVRTSEETYLIHPRTDLNIKIRAETLDIKQLVRIQQGFQLWTPILKEAFPISASAAAQVMGYLTDAPTADEHAPLGIDDFLARAKDAGSTMVTVAKQRRGYLHEACILEFAEVAINGSGVHSVAIESEDLDAALAVADHLGINELPNQSYQRAIRHALGV
jgi:hypothetical protein